MHGFPPPRPLGKFVLFAEVIAKVYISVLQTYLLITILSILIAHPQYEYCIFTKLLVYFDGFVEYRSCSSCCAAC